MALLALEFIALIGLVWLLIRLVLTPAPKFTRAWWLAILQECVVVGILGTAIVSLIVMPTFSAGLVVLPGYEPHSVFIVMWCVFTLMFIRKRYGARVMLPMLIFLYGLQEIIFNSLAFVLQELAGVRVDFFYEPFWDGFFVCVVIVTLLSYYYLKPRLSFHPGLFIVVAFLLVWLGLGLPSIDDKLTGDTPRVVWDIMYQLDIFGLAYFCVKPRDKA